MHDVHGSSRSRGVRDHLLHRRDAGLRLLKAAVTDVHEHRHAACRCRLEGRKYLHAARTGDVLQPDSQPERALSQSTGDGDLYPVDLFGCRGIVGRRLSVPVEGSEARGPVARRRPEIDTPIARALPVPFVHGPTGAAFELKGRRDAVAHLEIAADRVLTVRVQVDEAGCDDVSRDVDDLPALEWPRGDRGDAASRDPHVHHLVHPRLGVHDPSAPEYKIVGLSAGGGGAEREPDEYRGHGPHAVTHHRNIPCRIIGYLHRSEVESRQPVNPAYSEELSGPDRIFQ